MQRRLLLMLLLLSSMQLITACRSSNLQVVDLRCDYGNNPSGIGSETPHLSWQMIADERNVMQSAYRIIVSDEEDRINKNEGNIWDSGKISSEKSIQIRYQGKKLLPAKKYFWKVMVWDDHNKPTAWSSSAAWQMGLLTQKDWNGANWIGYEDLPASERIVPAAHGPGNPELGPGKNILPLLRKDFFVKKQVSRTTMFISGLGHFDMSLNGKKIGDHFLDPGWTKYDEHALYVTFDLTDHIKPGNNTVGVMLGNGFYHIPRERYRKLTGSFGYPKMLCRLLVEYKDGTFEDIVSDTSWKTAPGPITYTSIYGGEDYDANLEVPGWDTPSFNDKTWKPAITVDGPKKLDSQQAGPLKVSATFVPKKISSPKPGTWIYDMGQNASGIPQISVKGKKGSSVKISPGELLDDSGLVTQQATGGPSYFRYTLKGGGIETWKPQFTYYGFRYLQIEGAVPENKPNTQDAPVVTELKTLHTRNSAAVAGKFTCSNELFNKTFDLINWAIKSNMASVITDCPHREKLGWLEVPHLLGSSIRYNYDFAAFSRKIIQDMRISQTPEGLVPDIAPEYVKFEAGFRDSPEWGSSSVILPWYMYQWYGDKKVLEENYDMMHRYVGYLASKSDKHILSHGLGDWFDIGSEPPGESQLTPKGITATATYYYDLDIISRVAGILGKGEDEKKYKQLADLVKSAFNNTFFNKATKQYATGSQTANAMAVYMSLVEPEYKNEVVANIIKDIRNRNNSLTAGDIGYRYLIRVLENEGRSDVIFDMNSRSDVPGYGYQLAHGATSLTESWQAYRFVSNNHCMLGHLMEWFYSGLAGIRQAENGIAFDKIEIRPEPVGDVTFAKASYNSPYGLISSEWVKNDRSFTLNIQVPVNTTATVYLPARASSTVSENEQPLDGKKGIKFLKNENGRSIYEVGSGNYAFKVDN